MNNSLTDDKEITSFPFSFSPFVPQSTMWKDLKRLDTQC